MTKITAIHGGGDWNDASAEYIILPPGMDIEKEKAARRVWYNTLYITKRDKNFVTLYEWCLQRGARVPNDDELEVYEDMF